MKHALATLVLLAALPAAAQFPPARDLEDAQRMVTEMTRQIMPAMGPVRERVDLLVLAAKVHRQLGEGGVYESVDAALQTIEDFVRQKPELSREGHLIVSRLKQPIEAVKLGPPPADLTEVREEIHHNIIHSLQRAALRDLRQLKSLADALERITQPFESAMSGIVGAVEAGSPEKMRR